MKLLFIKMKKVYLLRFIVIGIIAISLQYVNCCKHHRSRRHHKKVTTLNDGEKSNLILLPYDNTNNPEYINEPDKTSLEFTTNFYLTKSKKTKRNSPDFSNLPLQLDDSENNDNKKDPYTLLASIANHDENAEALSDFRKSKRNPSDKDPLTIKSRHARDKKYMCLCEETKCRNKDCLRNQARNDYVSNGNPPNAQEYNEDNSAEQFDDGNINEVIVAEKNSNEPKKFNIPFAHNVNFDQRVIVGGKPKPPPNTFYPVYANPQIYHYTPYTLAQPGLMYAAVTPFQQNYAPTAAYDQLPSPSPIPANLLKLWKTGIQKLASFVTGNKANDPQPVQQQAEYLPKYSSENTGNNVDGNSAENSKETNQLQNIDYQNTPKTSVEPSKITTPRQVDNGRYDYANLYNRPGNNYYPAQGSNKNIEDLRPAYGYSTDFPYDQQYTVETISADDLKFATERSADTRQLQFGDPTTTNYAPSYYSTPLTINHNYDDGMGNQKAPNSYASGYQNVPQNQYSSGNTPPSANSYVGNTVANEQPKQPINSYENNIPNSNPNVAYPSNVYSSGYQVVPQNQYPTGGAPVSANSYLENTATNEQPKQPINSYENSIPNSNPAVAYPTNNQNVPQYSYKNAPVTTVSYVTNSPVVANQPSSAYQPQGNAYNYDIYNPSNTQPNNDDLSIKVDKEVNDYKNNAPMTSVPNDSDLRAYNPPQTQAFSRPLQTYNQQQTIVIQPPASYSIENVNPPRAPANGNGDLEQSNTEMYNNYYAAQRVTTLEDVNNGYKNHYNPQKTATLRNANGHEGVAAANTESSYSEEDHMENLFRGLENILLNNVTVSDTPQIQAIDERPSTTYENNYRNSDSTLVQNAVKKVLNNFVPGKAEDLLANYGTERSRELARENAENLSPDIVNAPILKNLLNVPEVENMIVDTTNNLLNQVVGSPMSDNMPRLIKDTLRNVANEIARPTSPSTYVKKLRRFVKRLPRYDEMSTKEVFDKIKSIIDKSELGEEAATQPLAQNLIVKAVKHSLDKERGVVDEGTIRRAFNQLIKSKRPSAPSEVSNRHNDYDKAVSEDTSIDDTEYKLAPIIPITERRLQGGVWIEVPKNLVGKKTPGKSTLEEKRRKELEKQLDTLEQYKKPNVTENDSTERVGSPPTQHYSPDARVLEYIKKHRSTENPSYAITSQNVGYKNDVSTREAATRYYNGLEVTADPANNPYRLAYPAGNVYPSNPVLVTTIGYQNPTVSSYTSQQPNVNRLNLLVDPTTATNQDSIEQTNGETQDPAYMGKLVPLQTFKADDENRNLVWVGDGIRLPLTMRKMPDGSFALTLSDEVCKRFVHKKCPCCLPSAGQGVIVRERRNGESDSAGGSRLAEQYTNEHSGRDKWEDVYDDEYSDESDENNSISNGAPYKYQRYANEDKLIRGRTKALGNMLQWMKNVVTEAQQKRHRRRTIVSSA